MHFCAHDFGPTLRRYRAQEGYSLRAAAREVGISPSTLSRIECGEVPSVEAFATLCLFAGLRMDAFFIGGESKQEVPIAKRDDSA